MINFPLFFTFTYLLLGCMVSMFAMSDERVQMQHYTILDMEGIPEEFHNAMMMIIACFYVLLWPIVLFQMRNM